MSYRVRPRIELLIEVIENSYESKILSLNLEASSLCPSCNNDAKRLLKIENEIKVLNKKYKKNSNLFHDLSAIFHLARKTTITLSYFNELFKLLVNSILCRLFEKNDKEKNPRKINHRDFEYDFMTRFILKPYFTCKNKKEPHSNLLELS